MCSITKPCLTLNNIYLKETDIRNIKGLEHCSDKEVEKIIEFLALYAQIIYKNLNKDYEEKEFNWW